MMDREEAYEETSWHLLRAMASIGALIHEASPLEIQWLNLSRESVACAANWLSKAENRIDPRENP